MPSQSLTDELMGLVDDYRAAEDVCRNIGWEPSPEPARQAIVFRLQEIEKELTELRGIVGPYGQSCLERTSALPCSNVELGEASSGICWDGEDGG